MYISLKNEKFALNALYFTASRLCIYSNIFISYRRINF